MDGLLSGQLLTTSFCNAALIAPHFLQPLLSGMVGEMLLAICQGKAFCLTDEAIVVIVNP